MVTMKPGRPAKSQRICSVCREQCSPKDGDWFYFKDDSSEQRFVCKDCEKSSGPAIRRTTPVRATN